MARKTEKKSINLTPINFDNGKFKGMTFEPLKVVNETKERITVLYQAPNDGPRSHVQHVLKAGAIIPSEAKEAVRLAFSSLLPLWVNWDAESGYSDAKSEKKLVWSSGIGRFIPV